MNPLCRLTGHRKFWDPEQDAEYCRICRKHLTYEESETPSVIQSILRHTGFSNKFVFDFDPVDCEKKEKHRIC